MSTFFSVPQRKRYTFLTVVTKIGRLAQELSASNPWWRKADWATNDPDLQDVGDSSLAYASPVLRDLTPGCLHILRGPRRVGKTVAVKQKISELLAAGAPPTSIVRVATDGWAAKDLRTMVQNTALPPVPDGHQRTWFLDEVSAVTGAWDQQIKWLRDNDTAFRRATVVLTGSDASALTSAGGALAGRRGDGVDLDRTLLPIGFRTFVSLVRPGAAPDVPALGIHQLRGPTARDAYLAALPWLGELVSAWELYLQYGGFPRAVASALVGEPIPASFVDDVFNVIAGDAFKTSQLSRNTEMALLERLWAAMASPANVSKIGADVDVSAAVVTRHIDYLRHAFLLWSCPRRSDSGWTAVQRSQEKLYAVDPIVARLAHLRNVERADVDPTVLTEMQLGMAIRRRVLRENRDAQNDEFLFHVRTPARKEIDFVSPHLSGTAVEGKYTEDGSWRREAATVIASQWDGVLCTRNVLDVGANGAWAVPAGMFAYLVDT